MFLSESTRPHDHCTAPSSNRSTVRELSPNGETQATRHGRLQNGRHILELRPTRRSEWIETVNQFTLD